MLPFAVKNIDHLVFRVQDLERSIAFYGNVLGCEVVKRRDDLGLIHLRAGSSLIDLISIDGQLGLNGGVAPGIEGRNVDHLCLRIEPFDEEALIRHLALHNVQTTGPVTMKFGAEGFGPSLYFYDLDGNLVELKGPSDNSKPHNS